jgi:hypothetical protein
MQLAIYRFRLGAKHSIGRKDLLRLWAAACRSDNVTVSRVATSFGDDEQGFLYSLQGPPKVPDSPEIRQRISASLTAALPEASIVIQRQFYS